MKPTVSSTLLPQSDYQVFCVQTDHLSSVQHWNLPTGAMLGYEQP